LLLTHIPQNYLAVLSSGSKKTVIGAEGHGENLCLTLWKLSGQAPVDCSLHCFPKMNYPVTGNASEQPSLMSKHQDIHDAVLRTERTLEGIAWLTIAPQDNGWVLSSQCEKLTVRTDGQRCGSKLWGLLDREHGFSGERRGPTQWYFDRRSVRCQPLSGVQAI